MISPFLTKLIEDDMLYTYYEYSRPIEVNVPFSNYIFMVNYTPHEKYFTSMYDITNQFTALWTQEDIDYIKNNYPELLI